MFFRKKCVRQSKFFLRQHFVIQKMQQRAVLLQDKSWKRMYFQRVQPEKNVPASGCRSHYGGLPSGNKKGVLKPAHLSGDIDGI